VSGPIRHLSISQSHVFLLNSRLSLFIETPRGVALIPKLRA